ncbi:hypothetical protein AAHC03_013654 [Spirometra sp. Aus1]
MLCHYAAPPEADCNCRPRCHVHVVFFHPSPQSPRHRHPIADRGSSSGDGQARRRDDRRVTIRSSSLGLTIAVSGCGNGDHYPSCIRYQQHPHFYLPKRLRRLSFSPGGG